MKKDKCNQSSYSVLLSVLMASALLLFSVLAAEAENLYVSTDGDNINDGTSWEKAKQTIQAAIDEAYPGDVIHVAAGTYLESLRLKNNVTLSGEGAENTRIEYKGSGVVINAYGIPNGEISGFTIAYTGNADHPAIWLRRSSLTLTGNVITGSVVGVDVGENADPQITDNEITNNLVGIEIHTGSRGIISRNIISGNEHRGITVKEGADPQIMDNEISYSAQSGIYVHTQGHGMISGNVISDNGYRGITVKDGSDPEIVHNTVVNNTHDGIWVYLDASPVIRNNIVAKNKRYGIDTMGYYHGTDGYPKVSYNDVWGNERGDYNGIAQPATDISVDPLFADFENGDYRLQINSPCRKAGGDGDDLGAYSSSVPPPMQPPSVNITSTFRSWESGGLSIEAEAADLDGSVQIVVFEYNLDGGQTWRQIDTDTTSPYSAIWDTKSVIGTVRDEVCVRVTATDNDSLTDEDEYCFGVDNEKPATSDNHDERWHKEDFDVTLQADDGSGSGVAVTNYRINDGEIRSVSENGQPRIDTEGSDNSLEYWSVDNAGNEEEHNIISRLKLDKTPPAFSNWTQKPADLTQNHQGAFRVKVQITDVGGSSISGTPLLSYWIGTNISYRDNEMVNDGNNGWYFDITADWGAYGDKALRYSVQASDAVGNTSTSEQHSELIDSSGQPDYIISALESEMAAIAGEIITYSITLAGRNGFESSISLFSINQPAGVEGTLEPGIVNISATEPLATSQLALTLLSDAAPGDYSFIILAIPESGEVKELQLSLTIASLTTKTSLTIAPETTDASPTEELTLSGQLTVLSDASVELSDLRIQIFFTSPGGEVQASEAAVDAVGQYQTLFLPDEAGEWRVQADFVGTDQLEASQAACSFTVSKLPAEIVFDADVSGTLGAEVTIPGHLEPQLEGETLSLTILRPDGSISTLIDITTEAFGQFQHTFEPDAIGDWGITVAWSGNDQYEEALETLALHVSAAVLKGDVNDDGIIRSNDAILALRISVGLMIPTDDQKDAADMNGDGIIRSNDAILILRKAVGLDIP